MASDTKSSKLFSFQEGRENINGRYLRATHVRELGTALLIANICIALVLLVAYTLVLINWEYFTSESFRNPEKPAGGLYGRLASIFIVPAAFVAIPLSIFFLAFALLMLWPDGKGWTIKEGAFTKWYGKFRSKKSRNGHLHHYEAGRYYFTTTERQSMQVDVYDSRLSVYLPEGTRYVPYNKIYKIFMYRDLYVVRAFQNEKSWDIIIDLRGEDPKTAEEFKAFMMSKKNQFMAASLVEEPWARKKYVGTV